MTFTAIKNKPHQQNFSDNSRFCPQVKRQRKKS